MTMEEIKYQKELRKRMGKRGKKKKKPMHKQWQFWFLIVVLIILFFSIDIPINKSCKQDSDCGISAEVICPACGGYNEAYNPSKISFKIHRLKVNIMSEIFGPFCPRYRCKLPKKYHTICENNQCVMKTEKIETVDCKSLNKEECFQNKQCILEGMQIRFEGPTTAGHTFSFDGCSPRKQEYNSCDFIDSVTNQCRYCMVENCGSKTYDLLPEI